MGGDDVGVADHFLERGHSQERRRGDVLRAAIAGDLDGLQCGFAYLRRLPQIIGQYLRPLSAGGVNRSVADNRLQLSLLEHLGRLCELGQWSHPQLRRHTALLQVALMQFRRADRSDENGPGEPRRRDARARRLLMDEVGIEGALFAQEKGGSALEPSADLVDDRYRARITRD